ncbi:MAG TPA: glycosyltransferase [Gammaproteobacteria bacterium]|nr:glycosyltransferase [Gammaproteobacteria bacterium]
MHGTFVFERARAIAKLTPVRVIAPMSWIRSGHRNPFKRMRQSRGYEERDGLRIWHPLFVYIPKILKPLDGLAMFLSILPTVLKLQRAERADLLDAHFVFPEGVAAALLKKLLHLPLVITLRGKLPLIARHPWRLRLAVWALRQADQVIAVATPLAALAVELGVQPERMHVIPNGIDARRFEMIPRHEARDRLGWPRGGRLIVAVGHLSPLKRFHLIIDALPCLPADVRLVIVGGPGPDRDVGAELTRQIARLNLDARCRLAGPLSPAEVALAVNAADVFVLASETEGSPNALMEALAAGTPAVASRVGEVERFVQEGVNGSLFDAGEGHLLAEKIEAALARDWDREVIRGSVVSRDWDCVAQEVLEVFCLAVNVEEPASQSKLPRLRQGTEPSRSRVYKSSK